MVLEVKGRQGATEDKKLEHLEEKERDAVSKPSSSNRPSLEMQPSVTDENDQQRMRNDVLLHRGLPRKAGLEPLTQDSATLK